MAVKIVGTPSNVLIDVIDNGSARVALVAGHAAVAAITGLIVVVVVVVGAALVEDPAVPTMMPIASAAMARGITIASTRAVRAGGGAAASVGFVAEMGAPQLVQNFSAPCDT